MILQNNKVYKKERKKERKMILENNKVYKKERKKDDIVE